MYAKLQPATDSTGGVTYKRLVDKKIVDLVQKRQDLLASYRHHGTKTFPGNPQYKIGQVISGEELNSMKLSGKVPVKESL
jgi:hypothetical protein